MSFINWVVKKLINIGAVTTINALVGKKVAGIGALFRSEELGGYQDPNHIGDYYYNEGDGNWYNSPPMPDYGKWDWTGKANEAEKRRLDMLRDAYQSTNDIENINPNFDYWGGNFKEKLKDPHDKWWDAWDYRLNRPRDPLALDLDGDGLETTNVRTRHTLFDFDGKNNILEATAGLGSDDGFLVRDLYNTPKKTRNFTNTAKTSIIN